MVNQVLRKILIAGLAAVALLIVAGDHSMFSSQIASLYN